MTLGEMGVQEHMNGTPPDVMKQIRSDEFTRAMKYLRADGILLDSGDLQLQFLPKESLIMSILTPLRQNNYGVVFSFRPEPTIFVDHPDHDETGSITRFAAAAVNVSNFHPEIPAPKERPELFLLTRDVSEASHMIPITWATQHHRLSYLEGFYPSQFPIESIAQSGIIFDRLSQHEGIEGNAELYMKIR